MPSYERFIALKPRALPVINALLDNIIVNALSTGLSFVDSIPLRVCKNKRIFPHKVFKNYATIGKSSMG